MLSSASAADCAPSGRDHRVARALCAACVVRDARRTLGEARGPRRELADAASLGADGAGDRVCGAGHLLRARTDLLRARRELLGRRGHFASATVDVAEERPEAGGHSAHRVGKAPDFIA